MPTCRQPDCEYAGTLAELSAHRRTAHPGAPISASSQRAKDRRAATKAKAERKPRARGDVEGNNAGEVFAGDSRGAAASADTGTGAHTTGRESRPAAPRTPKRKMGDRIRNRGKTDADAPASSTSRERAPRRRTPRPTGAHKPTDQLLAGAWSFLSWGARQAGDTAVANCLALQAPGAGIILERATAGTLVDKLVLQRIVERESDFKDVRDLIGLPVCVAIVERHPEALPFFEPIIRPLLVSYLRSMVPVIERAQAEAAEIQHLADVMGYPDSDDPLQLVFESIFGKPDDAPAPAAADEEKATA